VSKCPGSRTLRYPADQDPDFWQAADPRVAVVSVGADNNYGHPNPQLLSALTAAGISVWRTDTEGESARVADGGPSVS